MKLVSVEPTPNPNKMKLNMDESLPKGVTILCTVEQQRSDAPYYLRALMDIEGVKSAFQASHFIALERNPKVNWQGILERVGTALNQAQAAYTTDGEHSGEAEQTHTPLTPNVNVFVQMFKGIPMQVKLSSGLEERRVGLPDRFKLAVMQASTPSTNIIEERTWEAYSVRVGDMERIGSDVAAELSAAYDEQRLQQLIAEATGVHEARSVSANEASTASFRDQWSSDEWKTRYAALSGLEANQENCALIIQALSDANAAIRRLATAYMGAIGGRDVLTHLFKALKDPSITVRRTAGDCLSDLGFPEAIPPMIEALHDTSKLVRWRAARFLYEVGDESALPALQEALADPEYEVVLQAKMAIERIESGTSATGPMWQQMSKLLAESDK